MLLYQGCGALEYAAAVRGAHSAPDFQGSPRGLHGNVDIGLAAECNRGDGIFGRGVDIERIFAAAGLHVPAADEQVEVLQI